MSSQFRYIIASLAAVSSLALFADTYTWKNTGTAGTFSSASNWTLTSTGEDATEGPGENDDVVIKDGDTAYTVTVSTPFKVRSLTIGDAGGSAVVTLKFQSGLSTNEVVGAVIVGAKGKFTHTEETSTSSGINSLNTATYKLNLKAGGDITIKSGGSVNADACGFSSGKGPYPNGGSGNGSYGAAYGGTGMHNGTATGGVNTYGSIRNPNDSGSGGNARGGGVIYLESGGTLTVSGSVTAKGSEAASARAAGGSIILKGNAIAGGGTVSVKGSGAGGGTWPGGGGGRIAIYTKENRAFSSLAFGTLTAEGGVLSKCSSGTIYFESAQHAPGCGELVIDGKGQTIGARYSLTIFNGNIRDISQPFGAITLKNKGHVCVQGPVKLTATNALTVSSNSRLYTSATTAGIYLAPSSGTTFTYSGAVLTNHNFICNAPGATVNFVNGSSMYIPATSATGTTTPAQLNLSGEPGRLLTLASSTESGAWTLKVGTGAEISVDYVNVSRGNASGQPITANNSVGDDYSKEHNWLFPETTLPGDPLTWTGAADTSWVNGNNWLDKADGNRAPLETDVITIPAGCPRYPAIAADTLVNSLVIAAGATNRLSGANLTVTNSFSCAGVFTRANAEKLIIAGEGDATLDFANGEYGDVHITKSGGTITLPNGLSAKRLKISATAATTYVMPATQKLKMDVFDIDGTDADFITLVSSTPGTAWKLQVDDVMRVRGVTVSDSNANDGRTIAAGTFVTNDGGNSNWNFTSGSAVEWVGGVDGNWTTDGNWDPVGVPSETAVVSIRPKTAAASVTLNSSELSIVPVGGLMIGGSDYTATLKCNKAIEVAGGVDVAEKGTLVLNSIATNNIVNCGFIVRPGATVTHDGPRYASTQSCGVNLLVKDDMVVERGGSVNVDGKGFNSGYGPAKGTDSGDSTTNPSHGGIGYFQAATACYGSILRPRTFGSPYTTAAGNSSAAGGQIAITVEGDLTVKGTITAKGGANGGGTGGSVWLTAERLLGSGTIAADGMSTGYGAAGGRVAIYQTVATSLGFSGSITYYAANPTTRSNGHGTRYYQFANSEEGGGTIYFNAGGSNGTSFPMSADGPAKSAYSKATVCVQSGILYVLADTKVKDINITGGKINLQGHTVRVLSKTHKDGKGWTGGTYANCVTENGGKIIWVNGLSVSVR